MSTIQFVVHRSSWFDTNLYDTEKIMAALKNAGAINLHLENNFGWHNQPQVVVFNLTESKINTALESVQAALNTQWIIIRPKNYKRY